MKNEPHTRLKYIEFVDMAYIDTEYIPTDSTGFEFEAAFDDGSYIQYGCISTVPVLYSRFHGGSETTPKRLIAYTTQGNISNGAAINNNDGKFHTYYMSKSLCRIDTKEVLANLSIPQISVYIGPRNQENVNSRMNYTMNRCRYAKIYENDKIVRYYIPVLKNGAYCMYDQIQGKYYYNAAESGYFTGG